MTNGDHDDDWYDEDDASEDDASEEQRGAGEAISGHATVTLQDFQAVWWALPHTRSTAKALAFFTLAVPGFATLNLLLMRGAGGDSSVSLSIVLPTTALVVLAGCGLYGGRARWARNAVADMRSTEGVGFVLDDVGLSIDAPGRQSTTAWSAMARHLETKDAYAVYLTPNSVMVVPKRAFAVTDQPRVSRLLAEKFPNRPLRGISNESPVRTLVLWVVLIVVFLSIWQFLDPGR